MFEGKTFVEILQLGGFTMYVLLLCSLISVCCIFERILYYRKLSKMKRTQFMPKIRRVLEEGSLKFALQICKETDSPFSRIVMSGLMLDGHQEREISNAMERQITMETTKLEEYTGIVGTIGNVAVYIGLFGTVLGIIRAFRDISVSGAGGMSIVIGGVSEALICTATGLLVAIPAVVAYNYFTRRISGFVTDMELCASESTDLITNRAMDLSGMETR